MNDFVKKQYGHESLCMQRWSNPVISFARSELRYCCRTPPQAINPDELNRAGTDYFRNNEYVKERRKEMLEGVRHSDCNSCWSLEDRSIHSSRSPIKDFVSYHDSDLGKAFTSPKKAIEALNDKEKDVVLSNYPISIEIMLDNHCDMKCIYCSHHYSTQWVKEKIEFGEMTAAQMKQETQGRSTQLEDLFWQWLDEEPLKTLDYINIIGGEPLISKKFYKFCDQLIEKIKLIPRKKPPIQLVIVSNLNLDDRQMEKFLIYLDQLLVHFEVDLNLSMEGTGNRSEYIRFGLSWQQWQKNLDRLLKSKKKDLKISFQIATNALSITSTLQLLEFIVDKYHHYGQSIGLRRSAVADPKVHSYLNLPARFHKYIYKAARYLERQLEQGPKGLPEYSCWEKYTKFLYELSESLRTNKLQRSQKIAFYNWFSKNDFRRKSSLPKEFPELWWYWQDCKLTKLLYSEND